MNDVLTHRVCTSPDTIALIDTNGREWTYAALDERVERTAGRLSMLGLASSDHLGILLETSPASIGIIHAAMRLGCVLVPLNTRLTSTELETQVERADLAVLVCEADTETAATEIADEVPVVSVDDAERATVTELDGVESAGFESVSRTIDDPALMLYTSGTTGDPKLVVLTRKNLLASAVASAFRLGVSPDDRWLNPLSVYHMGGFAPVFRAALYGTTVVLMDTGSFDAETTLDALDMYGCTGISLVPTMLRRLLDAGNLPDSLRFVLLGGAPASDELIERCARREVPVFPTYGMTETASQVATARPDEAFANPGTVGRPLFGTELSILDDDGNPLESDETGELVVSGPTVFKNYYNDPEATAAAFSERGFHTGDVGYRDGGGRLWVTGRRDEQISTGGELVDPGEVATAIRDHSSVEDVAVVGLSDPEWGEQVGALVIAAENLDADTIRDYCREHLAGFKIPRTIAFADSLPRTTSGTVKREAVREHLYGYIK